MVVASGTLDATLHALSGSKAERCLALCDASRTDLLLGLSAAHKSTSGPQVAAALMTGGTQLDPIVDSILEVSFRVLLQTRLLSLPMQCQRCQRSAL